MRNQLIPATPDLVCFSHLRWNFVFQRPQHLMSRFARHGRVFYVEEAVYERADEPHLRLEVCPKTCVRVVIPVLPHGFGGAEANAAITKCLNQMFADHQIGRYIAWYYTPMALEYSPSWKAMATVYDCMDELSLFRFAPPSLRKNEQALFEICDLVFTGGISLFEAKRLQHDRVYPFPSSVDVDHFIQARFLPDSTEEQKHLPRPRLGYAGVIDERLDLELIRHMAAQRPDWQFIMVGPVVKIDRSLLPRSPNIHWLGGRDYAQLPRYLAGWDVALMPFELNDATRYISPTKTPEYLAAGLPVISTAIHDVVRQYGQLGMVRIAKDASEFVAQAEEILSHGNSLLAHHRVDAYLRTLSWDSTWEAMNYLIWSSIESNTQFIPQVPRTMKAAGTGATHV